MHGLDTWNVSSHVESSRVEPSQVEFGLIQVLYAFDISALYSSTSNVAAFTADCKTITLVYHLVPNIKDGGQKPAEEHSYLSEYCVPNKQANA